MKTNYLYHLENFLGDDLHKMIPDLKSKREENQLTDSAYFQQNFVTNPVLRIFLMCARQSGDTISFDMSRLSGDDADYVYLKFLGNLFQYLEPEIESNLDYKSELKRSFLSYNLGTFYAAFWELLVGGFLKFCGCEIAFNSSKQSGLPDVVVSQPFAFANDAKLFNDSEFWLKDKIRENRDVLLGFLNSFQSAEVIVLVSSLTNFGEELSELFGKFLESGKGAKGDSLWVVNAPFYHGDQGYVIDSITNASRIRMIPSFGMTDEAVQKIVDKADKQFNNIGLKGMVWLAFPHPKGAAMERQIVGQVSGIPNLYKSRGLGMTLCDFMPITKTNPRQAGIQYALDVFTDSKELAFLNNKNFGEFVSEIVDKPKIFVS